MSNQQGQTLDLVNVVSVALLPNPAELGTPLINTVALFTQEAPSGWGPGQTYAVYKDPASVTTDFGSNSSAAAMANALFAQTPNPVNTGGYLVIIPRLTSPSLETVRDAIARTKDLVYYYGILIDEEMGGNPTEFGALCAQIQVEKKMFFYCSSSVADLQPGSMLDLVRQATQFRCRMFYHGNALLNGAAVQQTQIFSAAYVGRALSTDFTGVGTAMTMHGKALVNLVPDQTIAQTQLNLAIAAGIDVYVSVAGIPMAFTSGANTFYDEVYGSDWFAFSLQVAGFNYLMPTAFKIPQTEEGMTGLKDAYRKVCGQAVANGLLAGGSWTAAVPAGVPQSLFKDNIANIGYFVFSQPVAIQNPTDRKARKAPLVQIAAKLAGAIHSSNVLVQMNP